MRLISSRATFYYKRILPIAWFGLVLLFIIVTLVSGFRSGGLHWLPLLLPALMLVFGYFIFRKLAFDLVDEVFDDSSALVVRNGNQEDRIALSDISNVGYTAMMNPPRVTLSLRRPSIFGPQVTFCAPLRFIPFTTSPVIDELIERIDAVRRH